MSAPQDKTVPVRPIETLGEAEKVIGRLESIMDSLLATIEEETSLVRAGRLNDATTLETAKAELARQYSLDTERLKVSKQFLSRALPDAVNALRKRHDTFHALLQTNLTVLATAHAVSEGIIRGVSSEMARKQVPQTYGATGRANTPGPKASQPLAVSRSL